MMKTVVSMLEFAKTELLKQFAYGHLPTEVLKQRSKIFHDIAHEISKSKPSIQAIGALQNLLLAKDCAVRSLFE